MYHLSHANTNVLTQFEEVLYDLHKGQGLHENQHKVQGQHENQHYKMFHNIIDLTGIG